MRGVVFPICAVLGWAAAIYRGRSLLRVRDPAVFRLTVVFAIAGLTFTLASPVVWTWLDDTTGVPNLSEFGIHLSAVTLSFSLLLQLETWAHPPPVARAHIRRWLAILAVVLVTMVVLFTLTRPPYPVRNYLLNGSEARDGGLFLVYLLFYLAALFTGFAIAAFLCLRCARIADQIWLARGLRITFVGLLLAVCYPADRAGTYLGSLAGLDASRWEFLVPVFTGSALLLLVSGMLLPAFGPRLDAAAAWTGRWVGYRRLEPLWRAYYTAMPDIAFEPPGRADRFATRDLNHRLLRRMVEIWDGRLSIAAGLDPLVAEQARARARERGLSPEQAEAVAEAAQIKLALQCFRTIEDDGNSPAGLAAAPSVAGSPGSPGAGQWDVERERLVAVARAFAGSPVVAEIVAEHQGVRAAG